MSRQKSAAPQGRSNPPAQAATQDAGPAAAAPSGKIDGMNPVLSYAWERWNRLGLTWQEAVSEASEVWHLAVKLDEVRKLHQKQRNGDPQP